MAVEVNNPSTFTVKFIDTEGRQKFQDIPAVGITEAKEVFERDYPGCQVINIWRKQ